MALDDTIVALSSPATAAARIVIRVSGPGMEELLKSVGVESRKELTAWRTNISIDSEEGNLKSEIRNPKSESNPKSEIRNGRETERGLGIPLRPYALSAVKIGFPAWIYRFTSPRSYTGEDLVELHVPGIPVLAGMVVKHLIRHGARDAEPGEFTARAFFNGKIDLAQAEGIAAAIEAGNERQLAAARRLMAGELARRLRPAMDQLAELLALVEVGIDFSEEDVRIMSAEQIAERCAAISEDLRNLKDQSPRFSRLSHEPTFVLAGRPNAGKSTLLNVLSGQMRAIVSAVAGTTRDALSAEVRLRRGMVRMIDAAGLDAARESRKLMVEQERNPHPNPPPEYMERGKEGGDDRVLDERSIDAQMRNQAERAIEEADHLILVRDSTDARGPLELSRKPSLVVRSKVDLAASTPGEFGISAQTGEGLAELRERLDAMAFGKDSAGDSVALTARHLSCIEDALAGIQRAAECWEDEELLAAELRYSLDCLGQILGTITPDDILGKIFSAFCIGK